MPAYRREAQLRRRSLISGLPFAWARDKEMERAHARNRERHARRERGTHAERETERESWLPSYCIVGCFYIIWI